MAVKSYSPTQLASISTSSSEYEPTQLDLSTPCVDAPDSAAQREGVKTPERAKEVFHRVFAEVATPVRNMFYKYIRTEQKYLPQNFARDLPGNDVLPRVIVTSRRVARVGGQIGRGTYSAVHEAKVVTLQEEGEGESSFSPGRPRDCAVKLQTRGGVDYKKEAKVVQKALTPNSKNRPQIDRPKEVFHFGGARQLSFHDRFDSDLSSIDYSQIERSVDFVLTGLIDSAKGLEAIHRGGHVHRDIKGANILVQNKSGVSVGAVTDFGFCMSAPKEPHRTIGTVPYLAPFIFQDFDAQISRWGMQTTEADVFAFGRTIMHDVLVRLVSKLGKTKEIAVEDLVERIQPTRLKKTDKNLEAARRDPNHHFDAHKVILKFPTAHAQYDTVLELIGRFEGQIPMRELEGLKGLAELARNLVQVEREKVPTMAQVSIALRQVELKMAQVPAPELSEKRELLVSASGGDSPPRKRLRQIEKDS